MLAAAALGALLALASPSSKILLWYDMEGVTAAAAPRDVQLGGPNYPATRESLTEDVNAAIRGLLRAGASEVVLTDGHGSGNPEPDYLLDRLPKGARFDIPAAMRRSRRWACTAGPAAAASWPTPTSDTRAGAWPATT
jgi:hypothetical protein